MTPRGEGRHCGSCDSTVIDLSRVTRSQAESIVAAHGGKMCGRVRADAHGDSVFAPEPARARLLPIALAGLLVACSAQAAPEETPHLESVAEPPSPEVGLGIPTRGSFGGSLATGVMMPIGPSDPTAHIAIVHVEPQRRAPEIEDAPPTAEQLALTRRKHQQQHPPPITHHLMGVMRLHP